MRIDFIKFDEIKKYKEVNKEKIDKVLKSLCGRCKEYIKNNNIKFDIEKLDDRIEIENMLIDLLNENEYKMLVVDYMSYLLNKNLKDFEDLKREWDVLDWKDYDEIDLMNENVNMIFNDIIDNLDIKYIKYILS